MNKERLADIKDKYMPVEYDFNLRRQDIDYLIEQAENSQIVANKNGKLNVFLNDYSEARHWGQNVIDVAMDIIKKEAERSEVLEVEYVRVWKENEAHKTKNKRYRNVILFVNEELITLLTIDNLTDDEKIECIKSAKRKIDEALESDSE